LLPCCRRVVLYCREDRVYPSNGDVVERGARIGTCEVVSCFPEPCTPCLCTETFFVSRKWVRRELRSNVVFESGDEFFVFPKSVVEQVEPLFEALSRNEAPRSNGAILLGAPGCGKSSMVRVLSEYHALPLIMARPDEIISKYVGDTEKNVRSLFRRARASAPCVLFFDEADWLIRARGLSGEEEASRVIETALAVFFEEMQELSNERAKVLVIAATNYKESALDQAALREGRLGLKITFPLPDEEAVSYVLQRIVGRVDREWVRRFLGSGEPMSNIVAKARELAEGKTPRLGGTGRGYRRVFHPEPPSELERLRRLLPIEPGKPIRAWVRGSRRVVLPIIVAYLSLIGVPAIEVTNEEHIEEAIHVCETIRGAMIVPTFIHPIAQVRVDVELQAPAIFVGTEPPRIDAPMIASLSHLVDIAGLDTVAQTIAQYYGYKLPQRGLRREEELELLAAGLLNGMEE